MLTEPQPLVPVVVAPMQVLLAAILQLVVWPASGSLAVSVQVVDKLSSTLAGQLIVMVGAWLLVQVSYLSPGQASTGGGAIGVQPVG